MSKGFKIIFTTLLFLSMFNFGRPSFSATPDPCPDGNLGNLNCGSDRLINTADLGILLGSWTPNGSAPTPPTGQHSADLTSNNKVDETDLSILLSNWGGGPTPLGEISLVRSGQNGGYRYWLYENSKYPCGKQGNHQFLVLQTGTETNERNLLVRFMGGAAGFYYSGGSSYWPAANFQSHLYASYQPLFETANGDGLTKLFRNNSGWRIMVPSYCSHDFYYGKGQYNEVDDFARWGFLAVQEAIDFTQDNFSTKSIVTYGTSAGASGAFYSGYTRNNVAGIIMDSFAVDISASVARCSGADEGGGRFPCICDGVVCTSTLASRVGFSVGRDEPYLLIQNGSINKPIYLIWNRYDRAWGEEDAHFQFDNLTAAINSYNPAGKSVARRVCVTISGNKPCSTHSPTKYDGPETNDIYQWVLSLLP